MKKLILAIIFLFQVVSSFSQDYIILKNGKRIEMVYGADVIPPLFNIHRFPELPSLLAVLLKYVNNTNNLLSCVT